MTDIDFVSRDSKKFKDESLAKAVLTFSGSLLAAIPLAVVSGVLGVGKRLLGTQGQSNAIGGKKWNFPLVSPSLVGEVKPFEDREFDVIVYGATGFVGQLASKYMASKYGNTVKWAIAGRRLSALEKVKQECIELNRDMTSLTIIQVDSKDEVKLHEMCARTKVVATTVGPYQIYGTPLVRACISTSTSYCDITGEVDWHTGLIEHYDRAAIQAKSRIVSFCGNDSIPWDVSTFLLHSALQQESPQEELVQCLFMDQMAGGISGGTLATLLESVFSREPPYRPQTRGNPFYFKHGEQEVAPSRTKFDNKSFNMMDTPLGPGGFFMMAQVNGKVVGRSNAINQYSQNLTYTETLLAPSKSTVIARYLGMFTVGCILLMPQTIMEKLLPKAGEGPSQKTMEHGYLQVTGIGTGSSGTKVGSRVYFNSDPGYSATAKMLMETSLTIALSPEKCREGGVLTPAGLGGQAVFDRLVSTGVMEFSRCKL